MKRRAKFSMGFVGIFDEGQVAIRKEKGLALYFIL